MKTIASGYGRIFIWADDPKKAREIRSAIGFNAQAIQSPMIENEKWDANKMLQNRYLAPFISHVIGVKCLGRE